MSAQADVVRACLVGRILDMMHVASMQPVDPWLGPPCRVFFLQELAERRLQWSRRPGWIEDSGGAEESNSRRLRSILDSPPTSVPVSVHRIERGQVREIPPRLLRSARREACQRELYERATVDYWWDPVARLVHVDWIFGPRFALGNSYRLNRCKTGHALEEVDARWDTTGTSVFGIPYGAHPDPARTAFAHAVRRFLVGGIQFMRARVAPRRGDSGVGAPCERFFLRQRDADPHDTFGRVVAVWEVHESGESVLDPRESTASEHGEIRGDRYENAWVDFRADVDSHSAYVEWRFGPADGLGHTLAAFHSSGHFRMREIEVRWES